MPAHHPPNSKLIHQDIALATMIKVFISKNTSGLPLPWESPFDTVRAFISLQNDHSGSYRLLDVHKNELLSGWRVRDKAGLRVRAVMLDLFPFEARWRRFGGEENLKPLLFRQMKEDVYHGW